MSNSERKQSLESCQYSHVVLTSLGLLLQFAITGEQGILRHVIEQLNKIPLKEQRGPQERLHLKSLQCRVEIDQKFLELSFLQSFLLPIQRWADKQLGDYHLYFPEVDKYINNKIQALFAI